jgi:hypothetical protein
MDHVTTIIRHILGWLVPFLLASMGYLIKKINQTPTKEEMETRIVNGMKRMDKDLTIKLTNEIDKLKLQTDFLREKIKEIHDVQLAHDTKYSCNSSGKGNPL